MENTLCGWIFRVGLDPETNILFNAGIKGKGVGGSAGLGQEKREDKEQQAKRAEYEMLLSHNRSFPWILSFHNIYSFPNRCNLIEKQDLYRFFRSRIDQQITGGWIKLGQLRGQKMGQKVSEIEKKLSPYYVQERCLALWK